MNMSWKVAAIRRLAEPGAPRVFGRDELSSWLAAGQINPPLRTLLRALKEWEVAGLVVKAAHGVYLNLRAVPLPTREEAASFIRPGAVLSMATVLGRAGVLNNPSYWVTSAVPLSSFRGPSEVESVEGNMFRFAYMPDELLNPSRDWRRDALESHTHVATATPEKALMDWLYLASSPRGAAHWALPALHDLEMSDLDGERLDRLATRMGLEQPLLQLREAVEADNPRVRPSRSRLGL